MGFFRRATNPRFLLRASSALISIAVLSGCAGLSTNSGLGELPSLAAAMPGKLTQCEALLAGFKFDNTRIESSASIAKGKVPTTPAANAPPTAYEVGAHCLVRGKMHERKGSDGQNYAIGFEARLPVDWNGRFYYQANGGIDGVVQIALGATGGGPITGALAQGFAVLSADAGHAGNQNPRFGAEPEARRDYGYSAVQKLTPMAKALVASAYGRGPDRSYIGGCSNGGRHAMVAMSRMGDAYDGYLVGAPGYRLPNSALAQLWAGPLWQAIASPDATMPNPMNASAPRLVDLGSAFTAAERQSVADAVIAKCDALDGAKDGLVQDVAACQRDFDLMRDVATCTGARDGKCLTLDQKRVLSQVQTGGRVANGQAIYASFPYDPGIAGANWATWKFVNSQTLDPAAGYIFMSPPRSVTPFKVDIEDSFKAIYAKPEGWPEAAIDTIAAPSYANLAGIDRLAKRGAKVVMYHGVSDAIFSELDTRAWVDRLQAATGGEADQFVRHFPVPGMNHCSAGPAADQFDMLTPLVNWVERGQAPQAITATARGAGNPGGVNPELPKDWLANRTRPLCAYPTVAQYQGGNMESARSFGCR